MKQNTDWIMASTSYNPLELYQLIEKMTLAQTEDQYPFATVYDQEIGFYSFQQETMSNPQWYKKFNTKVDVGLASSIIRQHKVLLEYVAQENHTLTFATLSAEQKQAVCEAFLHQSRAQHGNLKVDLRNNFTTGSNRYPKTHQQMLHLLDKYSKTVVVPKTTSSEGSSFAEKGGRGGRGSKSQTLEDNRTRLGSVWLQIRRRGFTLSVWQWIPVHANEGETDGNQIRTMNCQALQTKSWLQDQT
jgi:hypothetical protein